MIASASVPVLELRNLGARKSVNGLAFSVASGEAAGLSGLLGAAADGRFGPDDDVVFIHTGGWPALFAPDGAPLASIP